MSAERYEIGGCELDVLAITGPDGTRYIDGEEIEARAIRQLQKDLAAVTAERDEWKGCAMAAIAERDQLRAQLAEYVEAPVVATVIDIGDECGENKNVTFYSYQLPPPGTELIARPKVKP